MEHSARPLREIRDEEEEKLQESLSRCALS